jgi:hypothetical protein
VCTVADRVQTARAAAKRRENETGWGRRDMEKLSGRHLMTICVDHVEGGRAGPIGMMSSAAGQCKLAVRGSRGLMLLRHGRDP